MYHYKLSLPGFPEVIVRLQAGRYIARRMDTGADLDLGPRNDIEHDLVRLDRIIRWLAKGGRERMR